MSLLKPSPFREELDLSAKVSPEVFEETISEQRSVARGLSSLLRHFSTIDATLLGILAVFQDGWKASLCSRILTAGGAVCLFLSLVAGTLWICRLQKLSEKSFYLFLKSLAIGSDYYRGCSTPEKGYDNVAEACPAFLLLGILFLVLDIVL